MVQGILDTLAVGSAENDKWVFAMQIGKSLKLYKTQTQAHTTMRGRVIALPTRSRCPRAEISQVPW
eukprot:m.523544 g.523544  ORF g.523544 m.523544 type:complete len:66 (-) comp21977_c1_seq18:1125-1322(-)